MTSIRRQCSGNSALSAADVDIIICVHNALDDVRACVTSVRNGNYGNAEIRLILVDDGSAEETRDYLRDLATSPATLLIRNEVPGGYTKAANAGLKAATARTIVLLNSDTIVPPNWLAKMTGLMERFPDVGMVGPLSNAASWQSVPRLLDDNRQFAVNELPPDTSVEDYDRRLEASVGTISLRPRVPLLNGFCIMLRRQVIDTIGYLDEDSFPRGYGEENDYCFRASDAGFGLMLAIDTYVFHAKSKSYGPATRNKLSEQGGAAFARKYPLHRIQGAVASMRANPLLETVRGALSTET
jgi:O-antigen biosynthesis protein